MNCRSSSASGCSSGGFSLSFIMVRPPPRRDTIDITDVDVRRRITVTRRNRGASADRADVRGENRRVRAAGKLAGKKSAPAGVFHQRDACVAREIEFIVPSWPRTASGARPEGGTVCSVEPFEATS